MRKSIIALTCALVVIAGLAMANRFEQLSVGELTVETSATGGALTPASVTATGVVRGSEAGITEGLFDVVNTTQLVFIASGVTNVIDADITN